MRDKCRLEDVALLLGNCVVGGAGEMDDYVDWLNVYRTWGYAVIQNQSIFIVFSLQDFYC